MQRAGEHRVVQAVCMVSNLYMLPNQSHGLQWADGHSSKRTISAAEVVYALKQRPPQEGKNKGGKL